MGLLDILNGMQNGPRGEPQPATPGQGGMSRTTMALLALLAYKAYKNFSNSQTAGAPQSGASRGEPSNAAPGGLAGVLRTILGGGAGSGNVLSRGIDATVRDLEEQGHGEIARSWIGRGANRPITADKLESALGEDAIAELTAQSGMKRDELLATLSQHLPRLIDELTPEGRVPTTEEAARMA